MTDGECKGMRCSYYAWVRAAERAMPTCQNKEAFMALIEEKATLAERERCAEIADDEAAEYQRQIDAHNAEQLKNDSWADPVQRERGTYLHAKRDASANIAGIIRKARDLDEDARRGPAPAGTADHSVTAAVTYNLSEMLDGITPENLHDPIEP